MRGGRNATLVAMAVAALGAGSCAGGDGAATSVRTAPASVTSEPSVVTPTTTETPTSLMPAAVATTEAPVVPTTLRVPRVPVPTITAPTVPPVVTTLLAPATTEPPLPVPELFDAVQGIGTPCVATEQRPDGCWFFVYASLATRSETHHVYSDAASAPWVARDQGRDCGPEAQPHHREREGCSFYLGPVHGRVAGQRECFVATTVVGGRESERSNAVCLTWTDHRAAGG